MGNAEKKINKVHAPYNFVPFSNSILFPYKNAEALPSHGEWDATRKTGEIKIRMQAETPVFVSNGDKDNPRFFRTPGGKLALPGSTIRGMVRENMQILSFGLVQKGEDVEDYQIFFRNVASASNSAGGPLKDYYQTLLGTGTQNGNEKSYTTPKNIQAGYLRKEGERYRIIKTGDYLRIKRKDEVARQFPEDTEAKTVEVFYQAKGKTVTALQRAQGDCPEGMKQGMLLFTGPTVGQKNANPIYLFPAPAPEAESILLREDDVISYSEDWERRKNVLKPANFWNLPGEDGKEAQKPVFYLEDGEHVYWGMTLFLRIGHRYPLSHGLPDKQKEEAAEQDGRLDYPHAILGYANKESAYRSRVSFGDLNVIGEPREGEPVPMILGEPKPSFYPGYAYGKNNDNKKSFHYSDEDFQLRGYKLYWLKEKVDKCPEIAAGKEQVTTTLRPLPEETAFQGVIRFKNLTEAELGLLLWSLRLDDNCYQSVGMGKPFGYGRMKLTIERLTEYDPDNLYGGSLSYEREKMDRKTMERTIEQYINAFHDEVRQSGKLKIKGKVVDCRSRPEIRDFLYMKQKLQAGKEFTYMELAEYQNPVGTLPTVRELRERETEEAEKRAAQAEQQAAAKPESMADMLQRLAAQKNGGVGGVNSSASRGEPGKSKSKKKKKR
ncbi:MAG: TIGR03986 family CRISPR-associated RAMP protein [Clostridiales bacterium]|nr:TIGR03986 family CRISPR-associated RAMP protein [Clostridiales bacterium]